MGWPVVCMLLFWMLCQGCVATAMNQDSDILWGEMHIIVTVECIPYFTFQILALAFSYKRVGQTGAFTRIMACAEEDLKSFSQEDMDIMATHVTPQYRYDPETGDLYPSYNRPAGILHWLENAKPKEEWVLMVDPDVMFRRPISPGELYVKEGWARAAHPTCLMGMHSGLSEKYIPEVEPRQDKIGGPEGRRADEAGSYYFLRTRDMDRIAPLWLNYTRFIRMDPDVWSLTSDVIPTEVESGYIAEMYGFVFGAAKSDVWHVLDPHLQGFPANAMQENPAIVHYGWDAQVENYSFDKHKHTGFMHAKCPPWNMQPDRPSEEDGGLMPHPPFPQEVSEKDPKKRYGLLLIIEVVTTINQALCERHRRMCGVSQQLIRECKRADDIREALDKEYEILDNQVCQDFNALTCFLLRKRGNREDDPLLVDTHCREAFELCRGETKIRGEYSYQNGVKSFTLVPLVILGFVFFLYFVLSKGNRKRRSHSL